MKQTDIMERALKLQGGVLDLLMQENVELKTKLANYKWQKGYPKREGEYWVVAQHDDGNLYYGIDVWVIDKNYSMWKHQERQYDETGEYFSDVVAWQEIVPFYLEPESLEEVKE